MVKVYIGGGKGMIRMGTNNREMVEKIMYLGIDEWGEVSCWMFRGGGMVGKGEGGVMNFEGYGIN